jgi:Xaa-Pro aminopeptidase
MAIEEAGCDALLVAGRGIVLQYGSFRYFGGFPLFLLHGYVLLIPGEPARLVLSGRDEQRAEQHGVEDLLLRSSGNEDIGYGLRAGAGLAGRVADALAAAGLGAGRLGVAGLSEAMPVGEYLALRELLPELEIEDASALVAPLKAVKTEADLAAHREAAALMDEAFEAFEPLVRAGADELELVAAIELEARRRGAEHAIVRVLPGRMDARPPISRRLLPGELVTCYVEAVAPNGYWAEKGACFAIGELPPRAEEVYEASELAFAEIERTLTAGALAGDVAAAVWDVARDCGCQIGMQIGHGIGLDHDLPLIELGSDQKLVAGMVVAVHPLMQDGPHGAFTIDQYTVTGGAPERHSRIPRKLYRTEEAVK